MGDSKIFLKLEGILCLESHCTVIAVISVVQFVTKKYSATLLNIALSNLTVKPKSLQNIDTHQFSEMSSVSESFNLKLDLSTHLTPIHSNAF